MSMFEEAMKAGEVDTTKAQFTIKDPTSLGETYGAVAGCIRGSTDAEKLASAVRLLQAAGDEAVAHKTSAKIAVGDKTPSVLNGKGSTLKAVVVARLFTSAVKQTCGLDIAAAAAERAAKKAAKEAERAAEKAAKDAERAAEKAAERATKEAELVSSNGATH